jgi:hypothetical protein
MQPTQINSRIAYPSQNQYPQPNMNVYTAGVYTTQNSPMYVNPVVPYNSAYSQQMGFNPVSSMANMPHTAVYNQSQQFDTDTAPPSYNEIIHESRNEAVLNSEKK